MAMILPICLLWAFVTASTAFQQHMKVCSCLRRGRLFQTTDDNINFFVKVPRGVGNVPSKLAATSGSESSRRLFFASSLMSAGTLLGPGSANAVDEKSTPTKDLPWTQNPINKRSGVTLFDAEKAGYNVAFVTYLTRFLLSFDSSIQNYWFSLRMPSMSTADEVEEKRVNQFAALSASVEVGLQGYVGSDGSKLLLQDLLAKYGNLDITPSVPGVSGGIDEKTKKRKRREAKEARRQIALLFGLLQQNQPTKELTKLLAAVDNGSVQSVEITQGGSLALFEIGKEPPVHFPPPQAGENYETAQGVVTLESKGSILSVDVLDGGSGYSSKSPPEVIVSPPKNGGVAAVLKANVASKGSDQGSIQTIQVVEGGSGYMDQETISFVVNGETPEKTEAKLAAYLGFSIKAVNLISPGTGYAVEKPIKVTLGDAPIGGSVQPDAAARTEAGSTTSLPTVIGLAYPKAERSSYSSFRKKGDNKELIQMEETFDKQYNLKVTGPISAAISGPDDGLPPLPFWTPKSSSADLLALLPAGVGLEYDRELKRYVLAIDKEYQTVDPNAFTKLSRRIDPAFGPRGRAPIERAMDLDTSTYLRFCASGAICASSVHLALTPLDVVKTKIQTAPDTYPSVGSSFQTVLEQEGLSTFFTGWLPTLLGNFAGGGILYALTEFLRRSLSEAAGANAGTYEALIILVSAATAAAVGAFLSCPFEAVRIRTVAQPDFAANSVETCKRMIDEEGVGSLVNAIPVFLVKNIPYASAKFLVFDLSTERLLEAFPAATEDLKLSLLVTLVGGILGGTAAAIVSNPADTVISEMKKDKTKVSPQEAANRLLDRSGFQALFTGLPLRVVFYSMVASLQFVVFDGVRFALGIGSDDLKLYLDVLGGALK